MYMFIVSLEQIVRAFKSRRVNIDGLLLQDEEDSTDHRTWEGDVGKWDKFENVFKCNFGVISRLKRWDFDSYVRFEGPRFKQYNRQQRDFQGKEKTSFQLWLIALNWFERNHLSRFLK